ncbi:hypothetical protein LNP74_17385 [Klebsiella pneumoniae subsp. pneumoniae]|nr:hypothetical protein [Klebsiella pneumoniae subsp. pneumoniae]
MGAPIRHSAMSPASEQGATENSWPRGMGQPAAGHRDERPAPAGANIIDTADSIRQMLPQSPPRACRNR